MIRSILTQSACGREIWAINVRGIVGKVQEQCDTLHAAILFEVPGEKSAGLQVDAHGAEHNGEVVIMPVMHILRRSHETGLSANLGCDFVVGKTGGREDRDLLASSNRVHGVDGGDTGGDHFFGIDLVPINSVPINGRQKSLHVSTG